MLEHKKTQLPQENASSVRAIAERAKVRSAAAAIVVMKTLAMMRYRHEMRKLLSHISLSKFDGAQGHFTEICLALGKMHQLADDPKQKDTIKKLADKTEEQAYFTQGVVYQKVEELKGLFVEKTASLYVEIARVCFYNSRVIKTFKQLRQSNNLKLDSKLAGKLCKHSTFEEIDLKAISKLKDKYKQKYTTNAILETHCLVNPIYRLSYRPPKFSCHNDTIKFKFGELEVELARGYAVEANPKYLTKLSKEVCDLHEKLRPSTSSEMKDAGGGFITSKTYDYYFKVLSHPSTNLICIRNANTRELVAYQIENDPREQNTEGSATEQSFLLGQNGIFIDNTAINQDNQGKKLLELMHLITEVRNPEKNSQLTSTSLGNIRVQKVLRRFGWTALPTYENRSKNPHVISAREILREYEMENTKEYSKGNKTKERIFKIIKLVVPKSAELLSESPNSNETSDKETQRLFSHCCKRIASIFLPSIESTAEKLQGCLIELGYISKSLIEQFSIELSGITKTIEQNLTVFKSEAFIEKSHYLCARKNKLVEMSKQSVSTPENAASTVEKLEQVRKYAQLLILNIYRIANPKLEFRASMHENTYAMAGALLNKVDSFVIDGATLNSDINLSSPQMQDAVTGYLSSSNKLHKCLGDSIMMLAHNETEIKESPALDLNNPLTTILMLAYNQFEIKEPSTGVNDTIKAIYATAIYVMNKSRRPSDELLRALIDYTSALAALYSQFPELKSTDYTHRKGRFPVLTSSQSSQQMLASVVHPFSGVAILDPDNRLTETEFNRRLEIEKKFGYQLIYVDCHALTGQAESDLKDMQIIY